jgi:phage tail sheath protein FI
MGRHAQRGVIVKAMQAMIASNENLRSELIEFNLMAAPGYPELIDEMLVLNADQKMVSFIIGDTPARLKPNATAIQAWATNANNAASNGDKGLTTFNENIAVYYPWGLSTNVDGSEVMVPPSSMALVTYAYNDAMQHVWYAPAGFERGIVLNATSVGYLSDEGEYTPVILNQGQRDGMYLNKINPIAYIPKRGLALYGQKTLAAEASALDRVNVARLCNYLRVEIDKITHPFLFKINNDQIRDSFKHRLERFLAGLLGMNAIEDFAVVCDLSNNTVERRNRSELWADVLIIPTKCVEFIYVPVRIREIGDTLEL